MYFLLLLLCITTEAFLVTKINMLNTGPIPRSTAPSVELSSNSFLTFGGAYDDFDFNPHLFYNDMHRFDLAGNTGQWTLIEPTGYYPSPRAFHALGLVEDGNEEKVLLIYGGGVFYDFTQTPAEDQFWAYCLANNSYVNLSSLSGPEARIGVHGTVHNNKFYVTGGINAFFQGAPELWVFDILTMTWTELATMPAPGSILYPIMSSYQLPLQGGKVVVVGGNNLVIDENGFNFDLSNKTRLYDINTNIWSFADDLPIGIAQGSLTSGKISQRLLSVAGESNEHNQVGCGAPTPQSPTNKVFRYYPTLNHWVTVPTLGAPIPKTKRHSSSEVGIFTCWWGGWDFDCSEESPVGQIYNTDMLCISNI